MKKIIVVCLLVLMGCGGGKWAMNPTMSPEQERISSVSDASKCTFIKAMFIEVAAPHRMNYFVTLNTHAAGGDSYKILSTGNERVSGMNLMQVNFEVYKCR
jgi:hypothetical protein